MKKIGFIGAGNMATAIIKGVARSNMGAQISAFDLDQSKVEVLKVLGVTPATSIEELFTSIDYLVLSVKPQNMSEVLEQVAKNVHKSTVIISIAAGITAKYISEHLGYTAKVVLVMPNTPLMLSFGATALSKTEAVTENEFSFAKSIFDCAGITEVIAEDKMNEVIAINGSTPAFIYKFAQGYIEYGKSVGLEEKACLHLFAQTLIGSSKMLTESGYTIDELITMVSSKGGTTIAGLATMEENGFSTAVKKGCEKCVERAYELTL